jgi:hypothetical protein
MPCLPFEQAAAGLEQLPVHHFDDLFRHGFYDGWNDHIAELPVSLGIRHDLSFTIEHSVRQVFWKTH